ESLCRCRRRKGGTSSQINFGTLKIFACWEGKLSRRGEKHQSCPQPSTRGFRMFMHNKRLQYTVRIGEPNPMLASLMLEQFGGPQGELAAAMRYFTQALAESDPGRKDMLFDIATEELSHLEIIGSAIVMLCKGVKGKLAEGAKDGELLAEIKQGG